jgi:hypothetical protein
LSFGGIGFVVPQLFGFLIAGFCVWFGIGSLFRGISDFRHHARRKTRRPR